MAVETVASHMSPSPSSSRTRSLAVLSVGVVVIASLPWLRSLSGPYHFDDWTTPMSDPASQSLRAFFTHVFSTLRPVSKLTFAVESELGYGAVPEARRAVSALIHALSALLLFRWLVALRTPLAVSAALAILFGVHPIQAEGVLSVAGRGMPLALVFVLGSFLLLDRDRRGASSAMFALACLSRETAVFALFPLALHELARRDPSRGRRDLLRALGRLEWHATVALAFTAMTLLHHRYGALLDFSMHARPYGPSVAAQLAAVPVGLSLYARFGALTIDHGEALPHGFDAPLVLIGAACLVGLIGAAGWFAWRRHRVEAVGLGLVVAALLPTQSFIPKLDPLTERPFAWALAGFVIALSRPVSRAVAARTSSVRVASWTALVTALASCLVATEERGSLYATDLALWGQAASLSVVNPRPHYNVALAWLDAGKPAEALREATRAHDIDPFDRATSKLWSDLRDDARDEGGFGAPAKK